MVENQKAMPQPEMRRIRRIHFVGIVKAVGRKVLDCESPDTSLHVVASKGCVRDSRLQPVDMTSELTTSSRRPSAGVRVLQREGWDGRQRGASRPGSRAAGRAR